jgi:hypothetical protein
MTRRLISAKGDAASSKLTLIVSRNDIYLHRAEHFENSVLLSHNCQESIPSIGLPRLEIDILRSLWSPSVSIITGCLCNDIADRRESESVTQSATPELRTYLMVSRCRRQPHGLQNR